MDNSDPLKFGNQPLISEIIERSAHFNKWPHSIIRLTIELYSTTLCKN